MFALRDALYVTSDAWGKEELHGIPWQCGGDAVFTPAVPVAQECTVHFRLRSMGLPAGVGAAHVWIKQGAAEFSHVGTLASASKKPLHSPAALEAPPPAVEQPAEAEFEFDCFLSHDWGTDELGRNNHERVMAVNERLKSLGVRTWIDAEQMRDAILNKMVQGIERSSVIIVFVLPSLTFGTLVCLQHFGLPCCPFSFCILPRLLVSCSLPRLFFTFSLPYLGILRLQLLAAI